MTTSGRGSEGPEPDTAPVRPIPLPPDPLSRWLDPEPSPAPPAPDPDDEDTDPPG